MKMNFQEEQVVIARVTCGTIRRQLIECSKALVTAKVGQSRDDIIDDMELLIKAYRSAQVNLDSAIQIAKALGVEL